MTPPPAAPNVAGAVETVSSHLHPTPSWSVDDHPVPTGREEVWRFTPVRTFRTLLTSGATGGRLELDADLPERVTVSQVTREQARELSVEPPVDRVAALAAANAEGATLIDIPAEVELVEPLLITLRGTGGTVFDHVILRVGNHAVATVAIRHEGSAQYANKTDLLIGDGAQVNLVSLQDWDNDAVHAGQVSLRIGRDAQVRTVQASMGGKAVRIVERAQYAGPGGSLEQFGLYFVDAGQHTEHRLFVDHNQPHTKSKVDYRGALQGQGAHSVWVGDVLIRKVAEGIETYEANKNLVLTDGCQADSVPNLEIETGEIVGAGHSSTTGRFDDEQLFYLKSRGIAEAEARRLVVHGFFVDIIRRIGVPAIEERMLQEVERELSAVTAGEDA
ncbi:MAG TPA: Fe-S cluster assembly protein SufD [Propionibacteriaceae bacterium]|nr:Fe-S cluster assembly protein SufD [Propionibacteriaceae bacterium]